MFCCQNKFFDSAAIFFLVTTNTFLQCRYLAIKMNKMLQNIYCVRLFIAEKKIKQKLY